MRDFKMFRSGVPHPRKWLTDAATVLAFTGGATGFRYFFNPTLGFRSPLLFHVLAVALTAQIAGTISGLIATGLSVILIDYFFVPPLYTFTPPPNPGDDLALLLFVVVGISLSIFGGRRKRIEDELRRIRHNLETAQQLGSIGSWESDLVGELWWSAETYRIFGVQPGTTLHTDDFFKLVHPDDRAKVREAVKQAVEGRVDYDIEHRITRKNDGQVRYVHQHAKIITNGAIRLIGSIQDITESRQMFAALQRAHERLALKHEVARIGTFDWFIPEGRQEWSPEMESIYGIHTDTHEHTFDEWKAFVYPDDLPATLAAMDQAIRSRRSTLDITYRVRRPDENVIWIHSRGKYEYTSEGQPIHMLGVNLEITELKRAEEETKVLRGLLPTCAQCKKIRDEQSRWQVLEYYISEHSEARFSHGLCPECYQKMIKDEGLGVDSDHPGPQ